MAKTLNEFILGSKNLIWYIDMDGVLCDYELSVIEQTGRTINQLKEIGVWWETIIPLYEKNFFRNLKPMQGLEIIHYLNSMKQHVEILTATGDWNSNVVAQEKQDWLYEHLGYLPKFNHVLHGENKDQYAKPNAILIDDMQNNINLFHNAGGIGIQHFSLEDTINSIKRIF